MIKTMSHYALAALLAVTPISGMSGMAHHAAVSENSSTMPLDDGGTTNQTAQEGLLPYGPMLYGHPIIPASSVGLPAVGAGWVPAAQLPADLLSALADSLNHQPDHQYTVHPERIVRVLTEAQEDMASGDAYVATTVEAKDDDGVAWCWTLTVAP
jgi:hypothetical protein